MSFPGLASLSPIQINTNHPLNEKAAKALHDQFLHAKNSGALKPFQNSCISFFGWIEDYFFRKECWDLAEIDIKVRLVCLQAFLIAIRTDIPSKDISNRLTALFQSLDAELCLRLSVFVRLGYHDSHAIQAEILRRSELVVWEKIIGTGNIFNPNDNWKEEAFTLFQVAAKADWPAHERYEFMNRLLDQTAKDPKYAPSYIFEFISFLCGPQRKEGILASPAIYGDEIINKLNDHRQKIERECSICQKLINEKKVGCKMAISGEMGKRVLESLLLVFKDDSKVAGILESIHASDWDAIFNEHFEKPERMAGYIAYIAKHPLKSTDKELNLRSIFYIRACRFLTETEAWSKISSKEAHKMASALTPEELILHYDMFNRDFWSFILPHLDKDKIQAFFRSLVAEIQKGKNVCLDAITQTKGFQTIQDYVFDQLFNGYGRLKDQKQAVLFHAFDKNTQAELIKYLFNKNFTPSKELVFSCFDEKGFLEPSRITQLDNLVQALSIACKQTNGSPCLYSLVLEVRKDPRGFSRDVIEFLERLPYFDNIDKSYLIRVIYSFKLSYHFHYSQETISLALPEARKKLFDGEDNLASLKELFFILPKNKYPYLYAFFSDEIKSCLLNKLQQFRHELATMDALVSDPQFTENKTMQLMAARGLCKTFVVSKNHLILVLEYLKIGKANALKVLNLLIQAWPGKEIYTSIQAALLDHESKIETMASILEQDLENFDPCHIEKNPNHQPNDKEIQEKFFTSKFVNDEERLQLIKLLEEHLQDNFIHFFHRRLSNTQDKIADSIIVAEGGREDTNDKFQSHILKWWDNAAKSQNFEYKRKVFTELLDAFGYSKIWRTFSSDCVQKIRHMFAEQMKNNQFRFKKSEFNFLASNTDQQFINDFYNHLLLVLQSKDSQVKYMAKLCSTFSDDECEKIAEILKSKEELGNAIKNHLVDHAMGWISDRKRFNILISVIPEWEQLICKILENRNDNEFIEMASMIISHLNDDFLYERFVGALSDPLLKTKIEEIAAVAS